MTFSDKYGERRKKFSNDRDITNDSLKRYDGSHDTPLLKYKYSPKILKPGAFYSFKYDNPNDIKKFIDKDSIFYDESPLILTLDGDVNYGLNLNAIDKNSRLRLFNILHNNVKIHDINGNKDPKNYRPLYINKDKVNNILRLNSIPYIKYDMKYVKDLHMIDSSELINISDLYFDKIRLPKGMRIFDLHNKVKTAENKIKK